MGMPQARYGVAYTFEVPMVKVGVRDFAASADWTPAVGEVKVVRDGVDLGNITTLPSVVTGRKAWQFTLSATEMQGRRFLVLVDATAVEDQAIQFDTLPPGAITTGKLQAGSTTTAQLAAAESWGDNVLQGNLIEFHAGAGAGQSSLISGNTGATDQVALNSVLGVAADSTTCYTIWPGPRPSVLDQNFATAFASTLAEESAVPAANAPWWTKLNWLFAKGRNKVTVTASAQVIRNDADSAAIGTSTLSDDGTTLTRGEFS